MFDSIERPARGFSGRPLSALLFAVGTGILSSYLGALFHLGDAVITALGLATTGVVGYGWYWAERRK
jgi:hypothetical protein